MARRRKIIAPPIVTERSADDAMAREPDDRDEPDNDGNDGEDMRNGNGDGGHDVQPRARRQSAQALASTFPDDLAPDALPEPDDDDEDDDPSSEDGEEARLADARFDAQLRGGLPAGAHYDERGLPQYPSLDALQGPTFEPSEPFAPRIPLARGPRPGDIHRFAPAAAASSSTATGGALPIWPDHVNYDFTTQLLIKRREAGGSLSHLTTFPKDATIEDVLAKWPQPGTYFAFAVDQMGREINPQNPERFDIPPDHAFFLQQRETAALAASAQGGGRGAPALDPVMMAFFQKMMDGQKAETDRAMNELREEREALRAKEAEMAKRDQNLALLEIQHVQKNTDALLQQFQGQNNMVVQTILALNTMQQTQAEAAAQRERDRSDALHRQAMEAQAASHKLMFEQMTAINQMHNAVAEQRRAELTASVEAEKARLVEQAKLQTTFMNAEEKRRREIADAKEAAAPKTGFEGLKDAVETVKSLRELTDDGEEKGGGSMWEKGIEMFQEMQRQKHEMAIEQLRAQHGYAGGVPSIEDDGDDEDDGAGEGAYPPRLVGPVAGQVQIPQPGMPQAAPQPSPFGALGTPMPQALNQAGLAAPNAMGQAVAQAAPVAPGLAPAAMSPGDKAQMMARITVDRLAQTPDRGQWQAIVVAALTTEPDIVDLLRCEGVYGVLIDAGADDALASEVCAAVAEVANAYQIPVRL